MTKLTPFLVLLGAAVLLTGCDKSTDSDSSAASGGAEAGSGSTGGSSVKLTGSGASFPAPLYNRWFKDYCSSNSNVMIDYQAKGSGAGIKDFSNGITDFGASDAAMTDEEIAKVESGVQLLPMTAGAVVLAYNLEGVESLKLSREAYIGILMGKIKKWNDPAIAAANEGVTLPDQEITVVHRSDSSGTTFVFTKHLSEISEDWANGPGTGKTVVWPEGGKFIAAPKNDGVTAQIKQIAGSIGYIEYGYAKHTKLPMADLENKAGKYVTPALESCQAALAGVEMPEDLRAWLPDPDGDGAYPIVTYTWLLCYKKYENAETAEAIKNVVNYCLDEGQKLSDEMGYVPLPENVVAKVKTALENIQ